MSPAPDRQPLVPPATAATSAPPRRGHLVLRLGVLALSLLTVTLLRWHSVTEPFELDEAIYMLMAKLWQDGGRPYLDLWDNKPIGTFALYRLGLVLFGYAEVTPRLLALGALLLATGLVAVLWWRARLGVFVLALLGVWPALTVLVRCHANGTNMEIFLLPFLLGFVGCLQQYVSARRAAWWWAAAALWAVSLLVKPVTLPFLLPLFGVTPWRQWRDWPRLLARLAGLAAGLVVLHLAVYAIFGYGPAFVGQHTLTVLSHPSHTLASAGDATAPLRTLLWRVLVLLADPALVPLGPFLGAGLVALVLQACLAEARARLWLWTAPATALAIVLPGSNNAHYYILALPLVLAGLVALFALSRQPWWGWAVGLVVVGHLAWWTGSDYLARTPNDISHVKYGPWFVVDRALGQWLREHGYTGQRLFVDGSHATIYFYSGNRPANRFPNAYALGQQAVTPAALMAELHARPPDLLVLLNPAPVLPGFAAWQTANYERGEGIPKTPVLVFRRRAAAP